MKVRPSVVLTDNNSILLMKYRYGSNDVYCLPGGNPEGSETLTAALVRELKEELEVDIQVGQLLLVGEVILPEEKKSTLHCVFAGQITNGLPRANPDQTTSLGCEWKELKTIGSLNIYPNVGGFLQEFTGNAPLPVLYVGRINQNWF